jgi:hypothetical protein
LEEKRMTNQTKTEPKPEWSHVIDLNREALMEEDQEAMQGVNAEALLDSHAETLFTLSYIGVYNKKPWFIYRNGRHKEIVTAGELEDGVRLFVQTPGGKAVEMNLSIRENEYIVGQSKIDAHKLDEDAGNLEAERAAQRSRSREESRHG